MKRLAAFSVLLIALLSASAFAANLHVVFNNVQGKPIPKEALSSLHCRDIAEDEPVVTKISLTDGAAVITLPNQPVQMSMTLRVPEFGTVIVYADGSGKGYSKDGKIDFVSEAAKTRLLRVKSAVKAAESEGVKLPSGFYAKLKQAEGASPYKSLAITLRAGDDVTIERAKHRISQFKEPRKDFLFGCNTFRHGIQGPEWDKLYKGLFNYGTAHLYASLAAPTEDTYDFKRTDSEVDWIISQGMTATTSSAIYLSPSGSPKWMKGKSPKDGIEAYRKIMYDTAKRYAGRVKFQQLINEPADYAGVLKLKPDEWVELLKTMSIAAREGDPNLQRMMADCHPWGENAAKPNANGNIRRSPYRFMSDCIKGGVDFEIVGLQMYYLGNDLLETERMLDKYAKLGKMIHITENGCASAPGVDPGANKKKGIPDGWHGDWTEAMQADWIEAEYTLFYSKPYITAASWWDLTDYNVFWPYGGFVKADLTPKESYYRLQNLLESWGVK